MQWAALWRHSDLFWAATSTSSQVIPILNKSLLTVLLQFVRGRPGPLLNPGTSRRKVCRGMHWWSIRITCPFFSCFPILQHLVLTLVILCMSLFITIHAKIIVKLNVKCCRGTLQKLCIVPCTAVLVGLWPVSDEVFPLTSIQEQCWLFYLLQCRSSDFDSLFDLPVLLIIET